MNSSTTNAMDVSTLHRPGVPHQGRPSIVGNAHWSAPAEQPRRPEVLKDASQEFRATFGTGQPPAGLSGALRRVAYRWPDYEARRWALLLVADRVDALEHSASRPSTWLLVTAGAALTLTYALRTRRTVAPNT